MQQLEERVVTEVVAEGDSQPNGRMGPWRAGGLLLGPIAMLLMLLLPAPAEMPLPAWRTAAVAVLMAIWWLTEAIPLPATALLPLALFPLLGVAGIEGAAAPYANSVIFLFLGGFLIAQAMQRWDLHRRIALKVILAVGTQPARLVGGFMLATGFASMWVSNTAAALMMLPMGLSVVQLTRPADGRPTDPNFATNLMLGIAYAASIGGLGTLIGTPPNALLAGYMQESYGVEIGFGQWMLLGVPLVAIGLPLAWVLLTRVIYPLSIDTIPGGEQAIRGELNRLGRWTRGERAVGIVFLLAALAWMFRPLLESVVPGLSDAGIAVIAGLALFLIPVDFRRGVFALDWRDARDLPWEVLLLFGGGLSLAAAISNTGLADWIGGAMSGLQVLPTILLILGIAVVVIFLTELTSNTAVAAAFLPVLGSMAVGIGEDPLLLTIPAAVAASTGFMMPVGTPPNALAYASGYVTMPQMARAGIWLNLVFAVLVSVLGYAFVVAVFTG